MKKKKFSKEMYRMETRTSCWCEGHIAQERNKASDENPYSKGSEAFRQWYNGFEAARTSPKKVFSP